MVCLGNKYFHYKKKICNCVQWWMLTRFTVVIISQYTNVKPSCCMLETSILLGQLQLNSKNAYNHMQSFIILTPTISNTCTAALILLESVCSLFPTRLLFLKLWMAFPHWLPAVTPARRHPHCWLSRSLQPGRSLCHAHPPCPLLVPTVNSPSQGLHSAIPFFPLAPATPRISRNKHINLVIATWNKRIPPYTHTLLQR